MAMLEVKDLEVYYGMIQALKGISFQVNEGEVIALIGANGAGKTTTLHMCQRCLLRICQITEQRACCNDSAAKICHAQSLQ